ALYIQLSTKCNSMAHRTDNSGILSLRTLSTLSIIVVGIILMTFICLVTLNAPCVSNFYNQMPQYPSAELTTQTSSTLNWIGFVDLDYVKLTADDSEVVQAWFDEIADTVLPQTSRARVTGEDIPPTCNHRYTILPRIDGTEIHLEAQ